MKIKGVTIDDSVIGSNLNVGDNEEGYPPGVWTVTHVDTEDDIYTIKVENTGGVNSMWLNSRSDTFSWEYTTPEEGVPLKDTPTPLKSTKTQRKAISKKITQAVEEVYSLVEEAASMGMVVTLLDDTYQVKSISYQPAMPPKEVY